MLREAYEYRAAGRADLTGRWGESAMLSFVYTIIACAFTGVIGGVFDLMIMQGTSSLWSLLLLPMGWGYSMTFLANHRHEDNDPFDIGHLFDGYRDFLRVFTTCLLQSVYILLWSLLLIIPGIIKAMSYSMTPFILRDRPDLKNNGAIELSMAMMDGHKADLFWLYLSFIGWFILSLLTLGIGYFWLMPYISSTIANFYEDVKAEFENGGTINYQETSQETSQAESQSDFNTKNDGFYDNYQKNY